MLPSLTIVAAGLALFLECSPSLGQNASAIKHSKATPLMALLDRFTAAGVPALGSAEIEVAPRQWDQPVPPGLPGNGLAQHPMLYVGEGYNKIFLVNQGKIIWTYSTGPDGNTTTCGCSPMAISFSAACSMSPK
jgi:hypothetical protein